MWPKSNFKMLEQTEARRAKKKIWRPPPPVPKGLDDRPLSPAPLSRGLDLARNSIAKEWSLAIWFRPQPTLEAVASYNHLIRHLSRWERKGWNSAWSSSLTHRGIQSGGGGGGGNLEEIIFVNRIQLRAFMWLVTPKDLSGLIRRLQTLCTAFQVNPYFHRSTALLVDFIEIATLRTLFSKIHFEINDFQPR